MTDRDIIREVAESDPWRLGHSLAHCVHCKATSLDGRLEDHKDGCRWVYCVEKMKEREDD
jgi:hypothetical protein